LGNFGILFWALLFTLFGDSFFTVFETLFFASGCTWFLPWFITGYGNCPQPGDICTAMDSQSGMVWIGLGIGYL